MISRIPTFRITLPILSSILLTACGGGGGGGSSDNSPDSGLTTSGYRISEISFDYDNNGAADATATFTYSDGYLTQEVYEYTGDNTEDLYRFSDQYQDLEGRQVTTYSYDALGRILQIIQRQFDDTDTRVSYRSDVYYFDSSSNPLAKPTRVVRQLQGEAGTTLYTYNIDFNYTNGLLTSYTRKLQGSDTVLATANFGYTDNVLSNSVWRTRTGASTEQILQYGFSWANNLIDELLIDINPTNDYYEGVETYEYNANQYIQSIDLSFANDSDGTDSVSSFEYDSNGLPLRQSWDLGNNGSVDGVLTFDVEAGTCRYTYAWREQEKPNYALTENAALPPGTGYYRLRACIVPES